MSWTKQELRKAKQISDAIFSRLEKDRDVPVEVVLLGMQQAFAFALTWAAADHKAWLEATEDMVGVIHADLVDRGISRNGEN
jgi:hypothetical protein